MEQTLNNCEMYKLLSQKESGNKNEYLAIISLIDRPIEELLEYTKTNFPNFTDHTIKHAYRILNYIYHILSEDIKEDLSATELFCLITSALFHDIGMSNSTETDTEMIRREHARLSKEIIPLFFENLKLVNNIKRIVNCVSYVCESHTKDLHQLYAETQFKKKDMINGELVRYGYLTILLRIGDLMDMEEERTSYIVRAIFPEYYNKNNSIAHHERCGELQSFIYSDSGIEATVKTITRENFKLWTNWFTYLKDEIIYANTYYLQDFTGGSCIPKFEYSLEPAEGANFSTEEIRFEIDDKGALWKIISNSIYTAEYDFLRELVQNAIDACLMNCYLDRRVILKSAFPREWPVSDYCVNILYSEEANEIIIHDNGIGMDMNTLKRYLFKTADSGYKHINVERDFLFPAIAKFGIGFVACLTKANSIKIYTQSGDACEEIAVEIEKDSNIALIERKKGSPYHGTSIVLELKDSDTYINIKKFLQSKFATAAVRIEYVNYDVLKKLHIGVDNIEDFDLNKINNILHKKKEDIELAKAINNKNNVIRNIISECDTLRQKILAINSDEVFPLNEVFEMHKQVLNTLRENSGIFRRDLLISISAYSPSKIDINHTEYVKLLSEVINDMVTYQKNNYETKIKDYSELVTTIGDVHQKKMMKEDVCIVFLSNDFLVEDVLYQIDSERIKTSRGIIFVKTEYVNESMGIEFSCVNPFFFYNGELAVNLVNVRGNRIHLSDNEDAVIISLDELYDIEYQLALSFIDQEEEDKYHRQIKELAEEKYSYNVDILFGDDDIKILRNIDSSRVNDQSLILGNLFFTNDIYSRFYGGGLLPQFRKKSFCQDGIMIDADISGLIPLKVSYYDCNFFADSRFELNVTRHDINRNSTLVSKWMNKYGRMIQQEVIKNIYDTLKECKISNIELKSHMKKYPNEVFERCAYKQFETLL